MIHGIHGWEIQPYSVVVSPMTTKGIELLFGKQPIPGKDGINENVDIDRCGELLRYLADHESDMKVRPPQMKPILIRNKDMLERFLTKLPMIGQSNADPALTPPKKSYQPIQRKMETKTLEPPKPPELKHFTVHEVKDAIARVSLPEDVDLDYSVKVLKDCAKWMGAVPETHDDAIHRGATKFWDASQEKEMFDEATRKKIQMVTVHYDGNHKAFGCSR